MSLDSRRTVIYLLSLLGFGLIGCFAWIAVRTPSEQMSPPDLRRQYRDFADACFGERDGGLAAKPTVVDEWSLIKANSRDSDSMVVGYHSDHILGFATVHQSGKVVGISIASTAAVSPRQPPPMEFSGTRTSWIALTEWFPTFISGRVNDANQFELFAEWAHCPGGKRFQAHIIDWFVISFAEY